MIEHAVDGVKQLAHDGHERLHRLLPSGEQLLVVGPDLRFVLRGNQGWQEQRRAQMAIADLADADSRLD